MKFLNKLKLIISSPKITYIDFIAAFIFVFVITGVFYGIINVLSHLLIIFGINKGVFLVLIIMMVFLYYIFKERRK